MRLGKLTNQELIDNVLALLKVTRPEVRLSAALGEDCAALDLQNTLLVSSDPITAPMPDEKLGALCVDVCCNDIAACGGTPIAMTVTLMLPPSCDESSVREIMAGATRRAGELAVDIVGGHTEFTDAVTRPVISGTALGEAKRVLRKADLRAGDTLLVTKRLALEGTCVFAETYPGTLTEAEREELKEMNASLGVTKESAVLSGLKCVSALHDITEGGVLGAVAEIAKSAGLGADLYEAEMPVSPLTKKICAAFGADPLRLLSSGSMLVATSDREAASAALNGCGIPAHVIGAMNGGDKVVLHKADGGEETIEIRPDEMCRLLKGEQQ